MRPADLLRYCLVLLVAASAPAAVINGTVRLAGKPPAITVPTIPDRDLPGCGGPGLAVPYLLLGTNQAVANAIVYLGAANGRGVPGLATNAPAILDQRGCEFVPRIQIARSGAMLVLRNSDPILHVVRIESLSGTNGPKSMLTVATPYAGFEKKYRLANFKDPVLLRARGLNGQEWMTAYIAVLPHPWAAITDENGQFSLRDVPPGRYKLYAWHEVLGTQVRELTVTGDRPATVTMEFNGRP